MIRDYYGIVHVGSILFCYARIYTYENVIVNQIEVLILSRMARLMI